MSWYKYMDLVIRKERPTDTRDVQELIKLSFKNEDTLALVSMLRDRRDFVKELSMVATINGIVTGYILLSPVRLQTNEETFLKTLWLEPVCVHPQFQLKGIGSSLIKRALQRGKLMGYDSVFVTGDHKYYSKFGFREARKFGIYASLSLPSEAFLAIELKPGSLPEEGKLIFPEEIFE